MHCHKIHPENMWVQNLYIQKQLGKGFRLLPVLGSHHDGFDQGFDQDFDLSDFVRTNSTSNANGILCLICNAWIQFKKNVRWHFQEIHLETDIYFLCYKCNTPHQSRSTFQNHLEKHHPEC